MASVRGIERLTQWQTGGTRPDAQSFRRQIAYVHQLGVSGSNIETWMAALRAATDAVSRVVGSEKRVGHVKGWIAQRMPARPFTVIGDLHGDKASLWSILDRENVLTGNRGVVFLGDYVDRGMHDLQCLLTALALKARWPDQVVLLRGNHELWVEKEGQVVVTNNVRGSTSFLDFYRPSLGAAGVMALHQLMELLPTAAWWKERKILFAHAGIPRPTDGKASYTGIDLNTPESRTEMLWSDPEDKDDVICCGSRFSFARKQWSGFRQATGVKALVRSHEAVPQGHAVMLDQQVVTLFSSGGAEAASDYVDIKACYGVVYDDHLTIKRVHDASWTRRVDWPA